MAKVHLDRLKSRFGYEGEKLRLLSAKIIAQNAENISNNLARRTKSQWEKSVKKITGAKRVIVPDVADVLPKSAVFMVKAAEKGKLITDTLRDDLTAKLRATLEKIKSAKDPLYLQRPGQKGRLNPKHVSAFEDAITEVYAGYVKRDPAYGMPSNIHSIAVTEMRSSTNLVKYSYGKAIQDKNPHVEVFKRWIHNKNLSKNPRRGHQMTHLQTVPFNGSFEVPNYVSGKGHALVFKGVTRMAMPHDPSAPPEQTIGCNCEIQLLAKERKQ